MSAGEGNMHADADTYSGSSAEVIEVRHSLAKAIRSCCSSAFAAGQGFCCKRNFTHVEAFTLPLHMHQQQNCVVPYKRTCRR